MRLGGRFDKGRFVGLLIATAASFHLSNLLLIDHHPAGERGDLDAITPGTIEQAMLDSLVHFEDELVDPTADEIFARQEWVGRDEGIGERTGFFLVRAKRLLPPAA